MDMNTVAVTLIEVHPVTREVIAEHEVVVDTEESYGASSLPEYFVDNLEDIYLAAGKAAAARQIDYDSFSSDSDYLDTLDRFAENLYLQSVQVPGTVGRTYAVDGVYPGDGGPFGDDFDGSCAGEAQFQAKWTMSENDGYNLAALIKEGVGPAEAVRSLMSYMDDQTIFSAQEVPQEDPSALLRELVTLAEADALETVRDLLLTRGRLAANPSQSASDEIVLADGPAPRP